MCIGEQQVKKSKKLFPHLRFKSVTTETARFERGDREGSDFTLTLQKAMLRWVLLWCLPNMVHIYFESDCLNYGETHNLLNGLCTKVSKR